VLVSNEFLDVFHRPKNKTTTIKITTFRKLVLLPSLGEKRGEGKNTYSVGSADVSCPVIMDSSI
jgi:hypothetical protein